MAHRQWLLFCYSCSFKHEQQFKERYKAPKKKNIKKNKIKIDKEMDVNYVSEIPTLQEDTPEEEFERPQNNLLDSKETIWDSLHGWEEKSIQCKLIFCFEWIWSHRKMEKNVTLRESAIATPTMKRKNGITKSAKLQPFQGACPIICHSPPASSTKIIIYSTWDHLIIFLMLNFLSMVHQH